MKKILFILIASFAISCTNNGVTVTFDDEKSNAIRAHYQNYLNNDIDGLKSLWSPDLKIYMNSPDAAGVDDIASLIAAQHANFDNISMSFQDDEGGEDLGVWVQTITYPANNGYPETTMTQTWFTWNATGKASGKTLEVPAHIGFQWADGKIVKEWHNFDPSAMMAELELATSQSEE
jgi:hypothetical protein